MDGENLREGFVEVAFEQWTRTEGKHFLFSRLQRISGVSGSSIGEIPRTDRVPETLFLKF